jgi:hypothetical protein
MSNQTSESPSRNITTFRNFHEFDDAFNKNREAYTGAFFTLKTYSGERELYGFIKNITSKVVSASHYDVNVKYRLEYFDKADTSVRAFEFYTSKNNYKVEVELNNKKIFKWYNFLKRGGTRKTTKKARRNRTRRH